MQTSLENRILKTKPDFILQTYRQSVIRMSVEFFFDSSNVELALHLNVGLGMVDVVGTFLNTWITMGMGFMTTIRSRVISAISLVGVAACQETGEANGDNQ